MQQEYHNPVCMIQLLINEVSLETKGNIMITLLTIGHLGLYLDYRKLKKATQTHKYLDNI